ncbi:MAG: AAA family ATPase [Verrucomicrobiaceae bacterium]|nr:AAA family ATPase [Verrucomicrobiaceae bacterium]
MSDTPNEPPTPPLPPGTPEEITRKLEDFIKHSLGGQVLFTRIDPTTGGSTPDSDGSGDAPPVDDEEDISKSFQFHYKPAEIKAHLDRFVIRQDEAKKVLATAVCDHYNHARMLREQSTATAAGPAIEFTKQNVLIVGPTGVGKTYLVKHVADLIGVPFVKADATKFSETGYVGGDVDDLVRDLVAKAGGNIELAEHGIIYLDEVDKLAGGGGERGGRDVSGRGVQTALLKLMEETEVPLYASNDFRSQMQMMFDTRRGRTGKEIINTRNILFIVSGAFSGLEKIIDRRTAKNSIGFASAHGGHAGDIENKLHDSQTKDFIDYGFEAEFIGRLPVRVVCDPLKAADLFEIMKKSEGSLIRQYEREFAAYGVNATFEDSALYIVAQRAAEEKTGARGLVTAWEKVLREFKFELPSLGLPQLTVDGNLVENPAAALDHCRLEAATWESDVRATEVRQFAARFQEEHKLELVFEPTAIRSLVDRAQREGSSVDAVCQRLFKDFPFGLRLATRTNGQTRFVLDSAAAENPEKYLSDLVVNTYRSAAPAAPESPTTPESPHVA